MYLCRQAGVRPPRDHDQPDPNAFDGAKVAFVRRDQKDPSSNALCSVELAGGEPQVIYRPPAGATVSGVAWTPNGRQLVVALIGPRNAHEPTPENPNAHLWLIPAAGGPARDLGFDVKRLNGVIRVRPDGRPGIAGLPAFARSASAGPP